MGLRVSVYNVSQGGDWLSGVVSSQGSEGVSLRMYVRMYVQCICCNYYIRTRTHTYCTYIHTYIYASILKGAVYLAHALRSAQCSMQFFFLIH